jgi:hypothetical protein
MSVIIQPLQLVTGQFSQEARRVVEIMALQVSDSPPFCREVNSDYGYDDNTRK